VGGAGRIDISRGIPLLEVPPARVDGSMGDVHPLGNPHFSLDPGLAPIITQNIVDGLARLAPENRRAFRAEPQGVPGAPRRAHGGVEQDHGAAEGQQGRRLPPGLQLLPDALRAGAARHGGGSPGVKALLIQPWNDVRFANRVAKESGARVLMMASSVGAVKGADNYFAAIDYNIKTLARALQ